jgi:hypothetical protein
MIAGTINPHFRKSTVRSSTLPVALSVLLVAFSVAAVRAQTQMQAEPQTKAPSSNVGKELHNPLSDLKEVFFQVDVLPDVGPDKKTETTLSIEPVYPFDMGSG